MLGLLRFKRLPWRYWPLAALCSAAAAVVTGIPTAIIPNPLFVRMIPAEPTNYGFWVVTSVLLGLLGATYLLRAGAPVGGENKMAGGGLLAVLAVGCPICNKLVVLLLGVSGALSYFWPLQPLIGLVSVALLLYALRMRLQQLQGVCRVAPGG